MNLSKSPLRRTTAVLAGALIGMAGAVALAAPASAHHPVVAPESSCANEDGTWKVIWKITNSEFDLEGTIVHIDAKPAEGSTLTGVEKGDVLPKSGEGALTAEQTAPADVEEARLAVKAEWIRDGRVIQEDEKGEATKPTEPCKPETSEEPEPESSTSAAPTPLLEADCTTMTIGLDNPEAGEDITLILKTSKGETRELEVPAGEDETTRFSAAEGFRVEVSAEGVKGSTTVEYERPEGCEGAGGGAAELPLTGAAAGSIAGGAVLLLAVGGVLFFLARRRKVKFTA